MVERVSVVWAGVFGRARLCWPALIITHIVYGALGIVLVAPLVGLFHRLLVAFSGRPALTDQDILLFVLTPLGLGFGVVVAAIAIAIASLELASMMAIADGARQGFQLRPIWAIAFAVRHLPRILAVAFLLICRLLLLATPFIALSAGIAWSLLTQHDINYYLSARPPEFWLAATGIALVLLAMAALLLARLIGWSLVLPWTLFGDVSPARCFAQSDRLTRGARGQILLVLLIWAALASGLGTVFLAGIHQLGGVLVPFFSDSIGVLVVVLGVLAVLWFLGNLIVAAVASGALTLVLVELGERSGVPWTNVAPEGDLGPGFAMFDVTPQRLALFLAVAVIAASVVGVSLLNSVRVTDDVAVVAHRGASGAAPENTLAAVRRAIAEGADWIEIDVQETAGGEVVVIHDRDLMKLAGVGLSIKDATLADLEQIDVGSWFDPEFAGERVPTLRAVLEEARGDAGVVIELKYYGYQQRLEARVAELVDELEMAAEIAVMSLDYDGVRKIQELRPTWKLGLLAATSVGDLTRLHADFLAVNAKLATHDLIGQAHAEGQEVWVWTVNDPLAMSRLISIGIDGLITDEPAVARRVLAERAELSSIERLLLHAAIVFDRPLPGRSIQ